MSDINSRKLVPAAIFGDGMILQRDKECRVFGKAIGEVTVVLEIDGNKEEYKAPVENGNFVCTLDAHEAGTGYKLTISAGAESVVYEDVCFGDVYYLSGQSNMELPVYRTLDVTEEEVKALEESAVETGAGSASSAPKSGEPLGGLAAAFDDAFGNVEWQPGEAESK